MSRSQVDLQRTLSRTTMWLFGFLIFALALSSNADEAVGVTGKKFNGRLTRINGDWRFETDDGQKLTGEQIAYVRFSNTKSPIPRAPLLHTLVMADQQQLSGSLVSVEKDQVAFVAFWGKTFILKRNQIAGIGLAN